MMSNRQRKSTVREDRRGNRLATTALACAGTIALAIVAFANAGQVGADTRWAGDSDFGAPYPTEMPEDCGSVPSTLGLGETTYATPPPDHDCPKDVTVTKRDYWGCFLNMFGGDYRCKFERTCVLERVYERSRSVTMGTEGITVEETETEDMCGYGKCGDFNVANVPS